MDKSPALVPSWAARIWADDKFIHLELPSTKSSLSHRVKVENTEIGLKKALALIRVRDSSSKIGTEGDLTQAQLDQQKIDAYLIGKHGVSVVGGDVPYHYRDSVRKVLQELRLI